MGFLSGVFAVRAWAAVGEGAVGGADRGVVEKVEVVHDVQQVLGVLPR